MLVEPPKFASEASLCDEYATAMKAWGFDVFPETSGWDLIGVAKRAIGEIREGDQVGVQAKLSANFKVLVQATEDDPSRYNAVGRTRGPHWRFVLVPKATGDFIELARRLGVVVVTPTLRWSNDPTTGKPVVAHGFYSPMVSAKFRRDPTRELWVPDVALWTQPGAPSPRSITPWKLAALKLCLLAEERGYLLKSDFYAAEVDMTRWTRSVKGKAWMRGAWVEVAPKTKEYRYTLTEHAPHRIYADIYEAMKASLKESQR